MKLGAQFYSLRTECTTPEALLSTMKKIKAIGYDVMQASAICDIEAEQFKSFIDEVGLPVTCTHKAIELIRDDTDNLIKFHQTIGCPVIGLGSMPPQYRDSFENVKRCVNELREPMKKIEAAGLRFAYHNHDFEFIPVDGVRIYDYLIEELPTLDFIHDVYWSTYAGEDPIKYIKLLAGAGRMTNIHFKDMLTAPKGPICPCGDGVIDFRPFVPLCESLGVQYVQIEQDNAPNLGDVFEQMKKSHDFVRPML